MTGSPTAELLAREFHETQARAAPKVARREWPELSQASRDLLAEVFRDMLARGLILPGPNLDAS